MQNKKWESEATKPVMEGELQYHIRCGKGDIAKYCLLPGDPERVDAIAAMWDESRFVANYREHRTFTGKIGGIEVSCCSTGAGSGSTTSAIEEVVALGADTLIRVGSCGAIQEYIDCGDIIIHTGAVRHDGASDQYVDIAYPAYADYMVTAALVEAAEQLGFPYHVGVSCSTASWYCGQGRPGFNNYTQSFFEHKVDDLRRAGVLNFEMEASALFTLAGIYGLRAGSVCTAFANRKKNEFKYGGIERSIQVANLAVQILGQWDKVMAEKGKKHWFPSLIK